MPIQSQALMTAMGHGNSPTPSRRRMLTYTLTAGAVIGGVYEIKKPLGHGGMGEVYLARHVQLDILRAIKILLPSVAKSNPAFADRFMQEARLAIQLEHENIVHVMDAQFDRRNGIYYIVMEYVDGGTVRTLLKQNNGPLEEKRSLEIVLDVAKALAMAERKGIVHRDIKPDNIMLTKEGKVKVADLGIAKSPESAGGAADNVLSQGISLVGTPAYIAPEQITDADAVDCRADIYSLGVTLYEMLAGVKPYTGKNTREILDKQVTAPIPMLCRQSPTVSQATSELVRQMMGKSRELRPRNWREVEKKVRAILHPESSDALKENSYFLPKPAVAVAAVLLLVCLLVVSYSKVSSAAWRDADSFGWKRIPQKYNPAGRRRNEKLYGAISHPPTWRLISVTLVENWLMENPYHGNSSGEGKLPIAPIRDTVDLSMRITSDVDGMLEWLQGKEMVLQSEYLDEVRDDEAPVSFPGQSFVCGIPDSGAIACDVSKIPLGKWSFRLVVPPECILEESRKEIVLDGLNKPVIWKVKPREAYLHLEVKLPSAEMKNYILLREDGSQKEYSIGQTAEIPVEPFKPFTWVVRASGCRERILELPEFSPGESRQETITLSPQRQEVAELAEEERQDLEVCRAHLYDNIREKASPSEFQKKLKEFEVASSGKLLTRSSEANFLCGLIWEMNWNMTYASSKESCVEFYEQAVHLGSGDACYRLGMIYEQGLYGTAADAGRATELYEQGAELAHPMCLYQLGKQALDHDEREKARFQFHRSAEAGNPFAAMQLCRLCRDAEKDVSLSYQQRVSLREDALAWRNRAIELLPEEVDTNLKWPEEFYIRFLDLLKSDSRWKERRETIAENFKKENWP